MDTNQNTAPDSQEIQAGTPAGRHGTFQLLEHLDTRWPQLCKTRKSEEVMSVEDESEMSGDIEKETNLSRENQIQKVEQLIGDMEERVHERVETLLNNLEENIEKTVERIFRSIETKISNRAEILEKKNEVPLKKRKLEKLDGNEENTEKSINSEELDEMNKKRPRGVDERLTTLEDSVQRLIVVENKIPRVESRLQQLESQFPTTSNATTSTSTVSTSFAAHPTCASTPLPRSPLARVPPFVHDQENISNDANTKNSNETQKSEFNFPPSGAYINPLFKPVSKPISTATGEKSPSSTIVALESYSSFYSSPYHHCNYAQPYMSDGIRDSVKESSGNIFQKSLHPNLATSRLAPTITFSNPNTEVSLSNTPSPASSHSSSTDRSPSMESELDQDEDVSEPTTRAVGEKLRELLDRPEGKRRSKYVSTKTNMETTLLNSPNSLTLTASSTSSSNESPTPIEMGENNVYVELLSDKKTEPKEILNLCSAASSELHKKSITNVANPNEILLASSKISSSTRSEKSSKFSTEHGEILNPRFKVSPRVNISSEQEDVLNSFDDKLLGSNEPLFVGAQSNLTQEPDCAGNSKENSSATQEEFSTMVDLSSGILPPTQPSDKHVYSLPQRSKPALPPGSFIVIRVQPGATQDSHLKDSQNEIIIPISDQSEMASTSFPETKSSPKVGVSKFDSIISPNRHVNTHPNQQIEYQENRTQEDRIVETCRKQTIRSLTLPNASISTPLRVSFGRTQHNRSAESQKNQIESSSVLGRNDENRKKVHIPAATRTDTSLPQIRASVGVPPRSRASWNCSSLENLPRVRILQRQSTHTESEPPLGDNNGTRPENEILSGTRVNASSPPLPPPRVSSLVRRSLPSSNRANLENPHCIRPSDSEEYQTEGDSIVAGNTDTSPRIRVHSSPITKATLSSMSSAVVISPSAATQAPTSNLPNVGNLPVIKQLECRGSRTGNNPIPSNKQERHSNVRVPVVGIASTPQTAVSQFASTAVWYPPSSNYTRPAEIRKNRTENAPMFAENNETRPKFRVPARIISSICSPPSQSPGARLSPAASQSPLSTVGRRVDPSRALRQAASEGREVEILQLLASGVELDGRDPEGCTPLHCAARRGRLKAVTMLLEAGADLHAKDRVGWTPLHCAAAYDPGGQCVAALVRAGARINEGSNSLLTPLHLAAKYGNEHATRVLLAAGAVKSLTDVHGRTPIRITRSESILRLLR